MIAISKDIGYIRTKGFCCKVKSLQMLSIKYKLRMFSCNYKIPYSFKGTSTHMTLLIGVFLRGRGLKTIKNTSYCSVNWYELPVGGNS